MVRQFPFKLISFIIQGFRISFKISIQNGLIDAVFKKSKETFYIDFESHDLKKQKEFLRQISYISIQSTLFELILNDLLLGKWLS